MLWRSKRGAELVEASIVMPVLILVILLLIRVCTFYLQILVAQTAEHREALERWNASDGPVIGQYEDVREVSMLGSGIYQGKLTKTIEVEMYLINEDAIVRAGEVVEDAAD